MTIELDKKDEKTKRKAGRPKVEFTPEQIIKISDMALIQCKTATIAEALEIDPKTLEKHCSRLLSKKRAEGKIEIHQAQRDMLKQPVMAIWLGKQHLEQSDKADVKHGADKDLTALMAQLSGDKSALINKKVDNVNR